MITRVVDAGEKGGEMESVCLRWLIRGDGKRDGEKEAEKVEMPPGSSPAPRGIPPGKEAMPASATLPRCARWRLSLFGWPRRWAQNSEVIDECCGCGSGGSGGSGGAF